MDKYRYAYVTALDFATDIEVKLPRFQRKKSWDTAKGFGMVVSLVKGYPLGVVVINKTSTGKWLLDGRQRRSTFASLYDNPGLLYVWACKFLKIKAKDDLAGFSRKYWAELDAYVGADNGGSFEDDESQESEVLEVDGLPEELLASEESDVLERRPELKPFLELLVHLRELHNHRQGDWFSACFDFELSKAHKKQINYYIGDCIDGSKLRKALRAYLSANPGEIKQADFHAFMVESSNLKASAVAAYDQAIQKHWTSISQALSCYRYVICLLRSAEIGTVTMQEASDLDAQKVFEIINTKGQKLSPAEISSADRYWNSGVTSPSRLLVQHSKSIYKRLEIQVDGSPVRWDVPASLVEALQADGKFGLFWPRRAKIDVASTAGEVEANVGYGFKLLAAIKLQSINKSQIEALSRMDDLNWGEYLDEVVTVFSEIHSALCGVPYFANFLSWNMDLHTLYGPAASIRVAAQFYMDWLAKGRPKAGSGNRNAFIANCLSCLDRLVYERITRQWNSASDNVLRVRLAEFHLKIVGNSAYLDEAVSDAAWADLMVGVYDTNKVGGVPLEVDKSVDGFRGMLLHINSCMKVPNAQPYLGDSLTIDHFIPESYFKTLPAAERKAGNWIGNLVAIPDSLNKQKSNKPFSALSSARKKSYVYFLGLGAKGLEKLSNDNDLRGFMAARKKYITKDFLISRKAALSTYQ